MPLLSWSYFYPQTFCSICDPITSTYASLNNWEWLKSLLSNEYPSNPVFGWLYKSTWIFGSIVGFWNYFHLARNVPLREKKLSKISNYKKLSTTTTHTTKLQTLGLVGSWEKWPFASFKLICHGKVIVRY